MISNRYYMHVSELSPTAFNLAILYVISECDSSELVSLGCSVMIASRNEARLNDAHRLLQEKCDSAGGAVNALKCNIREEGDVVALMQAVIDRFGKPADCLVNNSGGQFPSPASKISTKGWRAVVDTNLTGTFLCSREFKRARSTLNLTGGSIVNVICDMEMGFPGMAHTGAARAGVENLTKTLALEWSSDGCRVNAVAPGVIYSDTAASNYGSPDFLRSMVSKIPARRLGVPSEVSAAVCFLLSDAASYTTGATLSVNGGGPLSGPYAWEVPEHTNWQSPRD